MSNGRKSSVSMFSYRSTFSVTRTKSPSLEAIREHDPKPPPRRHRASDGSVKPMSLLSPPKHYSHIPNSNPSTPSSGSLSPPPPSHLRRSSSPSVTPLRPSSEIITTFHPPSSLHDDVEQVVPIGQVICSFRDIVTSPENRLVLDVIGTDGSRSGGTIALLLWEVSCFKQKKKKTLAKIKRVL